MHEARSRHIQAVMDGAASHTAAHNKLAEPISLTQLPLFNMEIVESETNWAIRLRSR